MSLCTAPDCHSFVRALGMCEKHYKRFKTHGDIEDRRGQREPIEKRFWRFVSKDSPEKCWMWTGNKSAGGYGTMKNKGGRAWASHVSYELHKGPVPENLLVLHHCDTPGCVNPGHLFIGTQKENLADRNAKGRFHPVNGEQHGRRKLTAQQVIAIRNDPRDNKEIAAEYGVNRTNIHYIKIRKSWRHLP